MTSEAKKHDDVGTSKTSSRQGSHRRRFAFRLLTLGTALFISLPTAEIALRIYVAARGWTANCYVGSIQMHVPHTRNGYTLAANHEYRSGVYKISTNEHGVRGRSMTLEKPADTTRIAVLGGSSVFGYLVSDGAEACSQLQDRLNSGDRKVEVINAGVPGYNLFQTTIRYRETIAPLSPDVVVLYLGWNDLPYLVSRDPQQNHFRQGPCAPDWQRSLSHSVLYGFVFHRLLGDTSNFTPPKRAGGTVTTAGAEQFAKNLQELKRQIGPHVDIVICSQATLAHPTADSDVLPRLGNDDEHAKQTIALAKWLRNRLRQFADENELVFIDGYNAIPTDVSMLGDPIHLTEDGETALAKLLASRLHKMLE